LQPHATGPCHRGEEESLAAEQRRLDAAHALDVIAHARIERDETPRIDLERLTRRERNLDHSAARVNEDLAGALELLQDEAFPAKEARANPLREGDGDVDVAPGTQERVLLTEHRLGRQRHRDDLPGMRPGERHAPGLALASEVRDEEAFARQ